MSMGTACLRSVVKRRSFREVVQLSPLLPRIVPDLGFAAPFDQAVPHLPLTQGAHLLGLAVGPTNVGKAHILPVPAGVVIVHAPLGVALERWMPVFM